MLVKSPQSSTNMQAKLPFLLLIVTSTLTQPLPELCVQDQCMDSVVGKLAGNVPLNVAYGHGGTVADGAELSKAQAAHAPTVTFTGASPSKLHTLIMVDPDAPSPDNPTMAQWLHWIVANIPGGDVSKGDTITPYAGPTPPRGTHRYILMLYEQPEGVKVPKTHIDQRAKFNAAKWAAEHKLPAHPVGAVHFVTKAGH